MDLEFKHVVFFISLICGVPAGIAASLAFRWVERLAWIGMIALGCMGNFVSINFWSFEEYRGSSRGVEITIVDLCMLVILGVMILRRAAKLKLVIPGLLLYILYFILSAVSIRNGDNVLYSLAELWKMSRMLLYFITAFNYMLWRADFDMLLMTFAGIGYVNLLQVLNQKYHYGIYQPCGFFPHQNSMALYFELVGPLFFALWLNINKLSRWQKYVFPSAFFCISGAVILSYSRMAILLYPSECLFVLFASLLLNFQKKQIRIASVMIFLGMIGVALMLPRIIERFIYAPKASGQTRINLAIAAKNMANDKFFGVGLNNWGIKINPPYTYSEHRDSMNRRKDYKDGIVETIYMLVAAECGWITLGGLLLWFGYYVVWLMVLIWQFRKTDYFFLAIGLFSGYSTIDVHSCFEWVLKQSTNFYQIMLFFAVTAYLITIRKSVVRSKHANPTAVKSEAIKDLSTQGLSETR